MQPESALARINGANVVFWDFDGVIKESVEVKSDAFEYLFLNYGRDVAARVRKHHEENGGLSRFDKIPLYLEWAGQKVSTKLVENVCQRFSELVVNKVIESSWVPGVYDYLQNNYKRQKFVLITATPDDEIKMIIKKIGIEKCFHRVYGASISKSLAISNVIDENNLVDDEVVVIGDSSSDFEAAFKNRVSFILRRTELNRDLEQVCNCLTLKDFSDE